MRAQEFIKEAKKATAQQVLSYINKTHHEPFEPGTKMHDAVLAHPRWELRQVPLLNLYIPDQEYDDVDYDEYEPEADPYDRVMVVEPGHAGEISQHLVDRYPIVIDADRYIIDGNHRAWAAKYLLNRDYIQAWVPVKKQGVAEGVPQPGPSSGAPKQFGPDAEIQTRQMTAKDIIKSVPGVPYYNNVIDDWDAKDYSWGVTKKVIEYATYLRQHPESLSKLPPAIVLNGKFEDGAHRVSALWLLQQRMDPKNPLWANAKLNVQFVNQGVTENFADGKVRGKSRPGRVKRAGASCSGSITDLRARAKKYGGERGKMYHWCANMKSGRKKANEGKYGGSPYTFSIQKRPLNVRELIQRGAIFITIPHGEHGWEPDSEGFSLVTLWNVLQSPADWTKDAKNNLKPSMYPVAIKNLNNMNLSDQKYNQILWSIKKLGIPEEIAFL